MGPVFRLQPGRGGSWEVSVSGVGLPFSSALTLSAGSCPDTENFQLSGLYRISETRVRDQGKYATSADVAVPGKEKEIL